jgi:hypothetical protein
MAVKVLGFTLDLCSNRREEAHASSLYTLQLTLTTTRMVSWKHRGYVVGSSIVAVQDDDTDESR